VTLYFGLQGVSVDKIIPRIQGHGEIVIFYLVGLSCFFTALLLIVRALGIYKYVYPMDLRRVIGNMGSSPPSDESFLKHRIAELTAAFHANLNVDEKRWRLLRYATWGMVVGIFFQLVVFFYLPFVEPNKPLEIMIDASSSDKTNEDSDASEVEEECPQPQSDYGQEMRELVQSYERQQQQDQTQQQQQEQRSQVPQQQQ